MLVAFKLESKDPVKQPSLSSYSPLAKALAKSKKPVFFPEEVSGSFKNTLNLSPERLVELSTIVPVPFIVILKLYFVEPALFSKYLT